MTTLNVEKVGLVADYSQAGQWAFDLAFRIARSEKLQLNIFRFLESPYDVPLNTSPCDIPSHSWDETVVIAKDRELREYYDGQLGDYTDVGFRVCGSARHNLELKRCLKHKEYQLLILPYVRYGVSFGNMPIEEFAYRFNAPVLLVGPGHAKEYHANPGAKILIDSFTLTLAGTVALSKPEAFQQLAVL